jgi:hypothetical protein
MKPIELNAVTIDGHRHLPNFFREDFSGFYEHD